LRRSFWIPFAATCQQAGLKPDKQAANAAVKIWLRDVANSRVHATTNEVPLERLVIERCKLQGLPEPYKGKSARSLLAPSPPRVIKGYQHPLETYDALLSGGPTA